MATTAKQTASNSSATSTVRSSSVVIQQVAAHPINHAINNNTSPSAIGSPVANHHYYHHSIVQPPPPSHIYRTNNSSRSNSPGAARTDPHEHEQEHIDIIAKQISDHAEAIYQTWKARGLAPTEILNCHTINTDAFDRTLTSSLKSSVSSSAGTATTLRRSESPQYTAKFMPNDLTHATHCIDTLSNTVTANMSNTNLKKLVSTFVSEDKARQQQQQQQQSNVTRKANILTSGTIKDALRKFENIDSGATTANIRPNYLKYNPTNSSSNRSTVNSTTVSTGTTAVQQQQQQQQPIQASIAQREKATATKLSSHTNQTKHSDLGHTVDTTNKLNNTKNVPDVLLNTIDKDQLNGKVVHGGGNGVVGAINNGTSSGNCVNNTNADAITTASCAGNRTKPETPAKPANLINHQPAWSLRNRLKPLENGQNHSTSGNSGPPVAANDKSSDSKSSSLSAVAAAVTNTTPTTTTTTKPYENDIKSAKLVKQNCQTITNNNNNHNNINNNNNNHNNSSTHSNNLLNNSNSNKSNDLMDKVLLEEERLINALKTGTVLNNDQLSPEVIATAHITANPKTTATKLAHATNKISSMTNVNVTNNANSAQEQQRATVANANTASAPSATVTDGGTATTAANTTWNGTASNGASSVAGNELDGIQLKVTKRPKNDAAVPHPEATIKIGAAGKASTAPVVRPFLTRGSVAERVMMFEKCPEMKTLRNSKEPSKLAVKPALPKPEQTTCTTLQRTIRNTKNIYIPRFHFPYGKPLPSISLEQTLSRLSAAFDAYPNTSMAKDDFACVLKICNLPFYWRMPLYNCTQLTPTGLVDGKRFMEFWKQMSVFCHDSVSRFVYILSRGQRSRPYILPEDLVPLVQDVVDTHPGLAFLKEAAEFHSRYVHTVIARIFYTVNRTWSGKITMAELRRSDILQVIQLLEEEEDINQIMAYFSYEHFYVIYCKFWELDRDHDLFIDRQDLARHNDHALSTRIIDRIFSGCVTKTSKANNQRMSYTEFVWFLLSEEDKTHPTAVEYWFRCMDLDGDGIISMYELEYFYEEQQHRMESIGIETLPFEDCLCQMLDMIKPTVPGCVTLSDLKRCKMTPIFYDTFFNLEKYMEHEQRDPFASQREDDLSDWDRYAAQEYELLVAEEGGDTHGSYEDEDDYESNIDILESHMDDNATVDMNEM